MRWLLMGLVGATLAGCSSRTSNNADSSAPTSAEHDLAFSYGYTVRLPAAQISPAQERLAQACEQLAPPRCRITGMNYRVDAEGDVSASLAMALATPIARRFGRDGVAAVEAAGGTLSGAEITGTDTGPDVQQAGTARAQAAADVARIDAQLQRDDLSPAERAELIRQRADAENALRVAAGNGAAAQAAVRTTPVSFGFETGTGTGFSARLADASRTAESSLVTTLSFALTLLAVLGPPILLILLLLLAWRRWGRHGWRRIWRSGGRPEQPSG